MNGQKALDDFSRTEQFAFKDIYFFASNLKIIKSSFFIALIFFSTLIVKFILKSKQSNCWNKCSELVCVVMCEWGTNGTRLTKFAVEYLAVGKTYQVSLHIGLRAYEWISRIKCSWFHLLQHVLTFVICCFFHWPCAVSFFSCFTSFFRICF